MSRVNGAYLSEEDLREFAKSDVSGRRASCRFWTAMEEPVYDLLPASKLCHDVEYVGICHRHPPTMIVVDETLSAFWPETQWNDWCGEHVRARNEMPYCKDDAP